MDRNDDLPARDEPTPRSAAQRREDEKTKTTKPTGAAEEPNPPHTTTGKITSPKFGSAGSGGLELEPGLDRD